MAGNTSTPSGETSTQPNATVVPAAAPPAAPATPVTAQATPPVATPPVETPPAAATPPTSATPPAAPAATPPATPPVVPPVVAAAPERYEFVLEGDQKVNQAAVDAITPALKEAGMSQAAATKLVTDFIKYQSGLPAAKNAADLEAIKADPQLGMLNLGRTQGYISEALAAFSTPAEREALTKMGMVNDPILVRFFAKVGRAMADAGQPPRGESVPDKKTTAQKLYGGTSAQAS